MQRVLSDSNMKFNDVDDLKTEIRRQLKIKEGAENFKKATTDKKSLTQCNTILKEANYKLQELHHQLQDLNAGITDNPSGSKHGFGNKNPGLKTTFISLFLVEIIRVNFNHVQVNFHFKIRANFNRFSNANACSI